MIAWKEENNWKKESPEGQVFGFSCLTAVCKGGAPSNILNTCSTMLPINSDSFPSLLNQRGQVKLNVVISSFNGFILILLLKFNFKVYMTYNTIQAESKHSVQMSTIIVLIQRINYFFFYKNKIKERVNSQFSHCLDVRWRHDFRVPRKM